MTDTYNTLTVEARGHVLLVGLNRPQKRNALTVEMYRELAAAYKRLEDDADLRCGLLYAHGDHFSGGIDLVEWSPVFAQGKFSAVAEGGVDPLGIQTPQVSKPVVMAVQGICYTIGIELLLASDIRVAARNTRFGQIEVRRGIYPVGGATVRFLYECGWGNAMRYLLTGDEFDAHEAYRIGLVQEVVEVGDQFTRALAIAETIAAQAPLGVYASLRSSRLAQKAGEAAAFAQLLPDLLPILQSEDAREGVQSFIERRAAAFKGR